jgi:hypothetical protein
MGVMFTELVLVFGLPLLKFPTEVLFTSRCFRTGLNYLVLIEFFLPIDAPPELTLVASKEFSSALFVEVGCILDKKPYGFYS